MRRKIILMYFNDRLSRKKSLEIHGQEDDLSFIY